MRNIVDEFGQLNFAHRPKRSRPRACADDLHIVFRGGCTLEPGGSPKKPKCSIEVFTGCKTPFATSKELADEVKSAPQTKQLSMGKYFNPGPSPVHGPASKETQFGSTAKQIALPSSPMPSLIHRIEINSMDAKFILDTLRGENAPMPRTSLKASGNPTTCTALSKNRSCGFLDRVVKQLYAKYSKGTPQVQIWTADEKGAVWLGSVSEPREMDPNTEEIPNLNIMDIEECNVDVPDCASNSSHQNIHMHGVIRGYGYGHGHGHNHDHDCQV